jgi:hypothetical protein
VSDQAQTVPWEKAMLEHSPVLGTDPSEEGWTIEDEQCQKIGGGYKAVKFGFLLFLLVKPTFYLRRSRVQRHGVKRKTRKTTG